MRTLSSGLEAALAGQTTESMTFQQPWTARIFAVTLAASKAGHFSLLDFQKCLIEAISRNEVNGDDIEDEEGYYTCWLEALSSLLESGEVYSTQQLQVSENLVRVRLTALQHDHSHSHGHSHTQSQAVPEPLYKEVGKCNK